MEDPNLWDDGGYEYDGDPAWSEDSAGSLIGRRGKAKRNGFVGKTAQVGQKPGQVPQGLFQTGIEVAPANGTNGDGGENLPSGFVFEPQTQSQDSLGFAPAAFDRDPIEIGNGNDQLAKQCAHGTNDTDPEGGAR